MAVNPLGSSLSSKRGSLSSSFSAVATSPEWHANASALMGWPRNITNAVFESGAAPAPLCIMLSLDGSLLALVRWRDDDVIDDHSESTSSDVVAHAPNTSVRLRLALISLVSPCMRLSSSTA
jgi:hypothetical protein